MNAWVGSVYFTLEAQARLKMTDRYSIHRVMLDLLGEARSPEENSPSGLQWVDRGQTIYGRRVDFLSTYPVPERELSEDVVMEVRPLPSHFLEHSEYRFQIYLNCTRCVNGKRVAVPINEIETWAKDRAATRGMSLLIQSQDRVGTDVFYKNRRRLTFAHARLTGVLKVTDRTLFKKAFFSGIGKGRAFGYGLLQLAVIK